MRVSGLWIYPIKSCRGVAVDKLVLDDRGPINDRRWMIVDEDSHFVSQREAPRLAVIDVAMDNGQLRVSAPGAGELRFDMDSGNGRMTCTVFRDAVDLLHVSQEADAWFSSFLDMHCRLMRMDAETERVIDRDYAPERRLVSLADAFPMLLIGTGSLELLNEKLTARGESPLPMGRFRPNLVVSDTQPHQEDFWSRIMIGEVECAVVKPCARCTIPTVDIDTGVAGVEPLRTLASYRKQGSKVYFGQNVIHCAAGIIRKDDAVSINASR